MCGLDWDLVLAVRGECGEWAGWLGAEVRAGPFGMGSQDWTGWVGVEEEEPGVAGLECDITSTGGVDFFDGEVGEEGEEGVWGAGLSAAAAA